MYLNIAKHGCDSTVNDADPNSTNYEIISDGVLILDMGINIPIINCNILFDFRLK